MIGVRYTLFMSVFSYKSHEMYKNAISNKAHKSLDKRNIHEKETACLILMNQKVLFCSFCVNK